MDVVKFIFTSLLCLCATLTLCKGQAQAQSDPPNPPNIHLHFDALHDDLSLEDERAYLDNLAVALMHDKELIAYMHLYAGRRACAGEIQARAARMKNYLVKRHGIQPEQIVWKDGGYRDVLTVEFLLWPRTASEPSVVPTVDSSEVQMKNCKSKFNGRRARQTRRKP
jgi:hypothetical protein